MYNIGSSATIWIVLCIAGSIPYDLVPEFKLDYEYWTPRMVKFKTVYDHYNLTFIKCSALSLSPATNGMLTLINELQPCRQYQCDVILINDESKEINRVENFITGFIAVSPIKETIVVADTNSISITLSYSHIDCINSFYVLIDSTRVILYTNHNLTTKLIISELSPCVNYHVVVLLNYQYTQYVLHDNHVKTFANSYQPVENIQYDSQTNLLTWSPVIIVGCDAIYQVTIQSDMDGVKNDVFADESKRNEYQLGFLPKCLRYVVSITPKGYPGLSRSISIEIGYKNNEFFAPGPVKNLTVDLINDSMLSIKWSRPTKNPECLTDYSLSLNNVWITTKAHEYIVSSYTRSEIYNITVCTVEKSSPKDCVKYTVDPSKIETLELQNITRVELSTSLNGKITKIAWNAASRRERGIKHYIVRLYDILGHEIYRQNVSSTEIYVPDLGQCEEYVLYIETVPALNWTNKIVTNLTFKTKPQNPDRPKPPEFVGRTSSSLTMLTDYRNPNDKCEIEIYRFACSTRSQVQFTDSENRVATINNLRSGATYYCYAMVKNEIGWSDSSSVINFETDIAMEYRLIELFAKQVSSKSIVLAWATTLNSMFDVQITKIKNLDTVPVHCKSGVYNNRYQISSEFNREYKIENLEPNTNYSIQVESFDRLKNYSVQIYVTTHPDIAHQVNNLHITSLTNETVSIAWEVPCILNGRIKNFIVTIATTNESDFDIPVLRRSIPFDRSEYTETSIKPNHGYTITVGIKLFGFPGPLSESTIGFISPLEMNMNRFVVYITIAVSIIIVFMILIGVVFYLHRSQSEQQSDVEDTLFIDLPRYSSSLKPVSNDLMRREFQSINDMDLSHLSKTVPQNQVSKNRNPDIIPYDFNRVVLEPNEYCFTDYINASYIDGYNDEKQFIATQGPNQETVYDFWYMVIQEKCDKIIMLTQLVENGCAHCVQYYPNANEMLEFDDIIVKSIDETKFGNFIKRSFCILSGKMKRHLEHYQYTAWPDRDYPQYPLCLIEFIANSGTQTNVSANPIIVHSSAGAGRTGTYIALDILFQNCRTTNKVSICETVKKLRLQRCGAVATFAQYEFLYAAIKSYYLTRVYKRNEWL